MRCNEARRLLALDLHTADPDRIEAARAHVIECSACQARLDQFSVAVLSGYEDEIPCVECRARMDAYAAARMSDQGARLPEDHPTMAAHLASCPECAEDYRLLLASLATLRGESAQPVEAAPDAVFDLSFARRRAPGSAAAETKAFGRKDLGLADAEQPQARPESPAGASEDGAADWRARLTAALAGLRELLGGSWAQRASRGALAGLAAVVLMLFTWLLVFDPQLPAPIEALRPAKRDTETPVPMDVSATQTMAVLMGIDWVDSAEGNPVEGTGAAGTQRSVATERVTPTNGSGAGTPTAMAEEDDRDSDRRDRDDGPTQVPEPSGLRGSSPITPTLDVGAIIGYPPPVKDPTRRAYPGPDDPEPPIGSPTPGAAGTVEPGKPSATPPADPPPTSEASPGPEPTETRDPLRDVGP